MVELRTKTASALKSERGNLTLHSQARRLVIAIDVLYRNLLVAGLSSPTRLESGHLSMQEVRAFGFLAHTGPTNMSDFAKKLGLPVSTATRVVNKLVREGMVTRQHSNDDRRVVKIELSTQGKELERIFIQRRLPVIREMVSSLTPSENKIFLDLIEKILNLSPTAN